MLEKIKVPTDELKVGMYVHELDRPWLDSPFLFQGFIIDSKEVLRQLQETCIYVIVDQQKTRLDAGEGFSNITDKEMNKQFDPEANSPPPVSVSFEQESQLANTIRNNTFISLGNLYSALARKKRIDVKEVVTSVEQMVKSVMRNPDAQLWLSHLRDISVHTALHSINVCILALSFGRHLGLNERELAELGVGALLHDIGKLRMPKDILNKPGILDDQELALMRRHPELGVELLQEQTQDLSQSSLDVIRYHHERPTGKGYPKGLSALQLDLLPQIVGIVDVYDAITNDQAYRQGMATTDALSEIFRSRHDEFDNTLIEQFIQCMGTYPIGSVVQLSSGEIGIVMSTSQGRRLMPKLKVIMDAEQQLYCPAKFLDLYQLRNEDGSATIDIKKVLRPADIGINVSDFIQQELAPELAKQV